MSGTLRKSAAPTVARLKRYLDSLPVFQGEDSLALEDVLTNYQSYLQDSQLKLREIQGAIESLERINERWVNLILSRNGQEQQLEQERYEQMSDDPEGMLSTIDRGKEAVAVLEHGIAAANVSIERITRELHGSSSQPGKWKQELSKVKLPKLNLPLFDGNIGEWSSFWAFFERTIDSAELEPADKLAYLFSALKGPAAEAVAGFTTTNNNYPVVVARLKEKYGDTAMIERELRYRLQEIPVIRRESDLIPTLNQIEVTLQQLETSGGMIDDGYTEDIITRKLPFWLLDRVYEQKLLQFGSWNVTALRKLLRDTVNRREAMHRITEQNRSAKATTERTGGLSHQMKPRTTAGQDAKSTILMTVGSGNSKRDKKAPKSSCVFCKGRHYNDECPNYTSLIRRTTRLQELQRCAKCLRPGHNQQDCTTKLRPCFYCKNVMHSSAVCPVHYTNSTASLKSQAARNESEEKKMKQSGSSTVSMAAAQEDGKKTLLMCKKTTASNPEHLDINEEVVVFLDPGSQDSFIDEGLARKLKLQKGQRETILIRPFRSEIPMKIASQRTTVSLGPKEDRKNIAVRTVANMAASFPQLEMETVNGNSVQGSPERPQQPQILVGMDNFFEIFKNFEKTQTGRYIVHTSLGPLLAGVTNREASDRDNTGVWCAMNLQMFWDLESVGITDASVESEDEQAYGLFRKAIMRNEDGRYVVGWPWRNSTVQLSPTFGLCIGRLNNLLRKLRKCPELLEEYQAVFQYQLEQGIIEVAPKQPQGIVHYLPHQMVLTPGKSTKLRVVFDASAKCRDGISLNEALFRGPLMLPNLVGILLRARCYQHVLVADVEKAFLQVGLHPGDRDVTRFLWIEDPLKPADDNNIVVYRYTRVLFGVTSSPFLLAAVVQYHLEQQGSDTAQQLRKNLYVDNAAIGINSLEDGKERYRESKALFQEACMNLRNYTSDLEELRNEISTEDRYSEKKISILGLQWDVSDDQFTLSVHELPKYPWTKRKISHFIGKHYDPLGLISPLLTPWKYLMQQLWKEGYNWDKPFEVEGIMAGTALQVLRKWKEGGIKLPRRTIPSRKIGTLHVFVDASSTACGVAVYAVSSEKESQATLLYGKSRLLPLRVSLTIPKAELLAVWMGAKAISYVRRELELEDCPGFVWSDSKCVLNWLNTKTSAKLPVFVRNRVNEIQAAGIPWRYVPSEWNPADIASRGTHAENLINSDLWWHGPRWLRQGEEHWPIEVKEEELVLGDPLSHPVMSNPEVLEEQRPLFDFTVTNSWSRMLSIAKTVMRTAQKWRRKETQTKYELTKAAERVLIRDAQKQISEEETKRWNLRRDQGGVLRMVGRMERIPLQQQPIYLPLNHHIVTQLVLEAHERSGHFGTSATLTELRTAFWIDQGRATVRKILHQLCFKCRRDKARQFALPPMAPLPECRITPGGVFKHVAIDYAGPFLVRTNKTQTQKRWIALFSCLTTRAVHLEVVTSLSTSEFVSAFHRFCARRGSPQSILSDNGTQLVGASKVIKVEWKFITPQAPWKGGIYERLIGLLKSALKRTIGKTLLSEQEFLNVVVQVERVLNARPITTVTSDSDKILRPVDFLIPSQGVQRLCSAKERDSSPIRFDYSPQNLLQQLKQSEECLNRFWNIWRKDYLQLLRERKDQWHQQTKARVRREPQVGEIVLLGDKQLPRLCWKVARVHELRRDEGGRVKEAIVQLPRTEVSNRTRVYLARPISQLYPLELPSEPEDGDVLYEKATEDPNLDREKTEETICNLAARAAPTLPSRNTGHLKLCGWFFWMFLTVLLRSATAIIAFDCTTPAVNISTINAKNVEECRETVKIPQVESQLIQLVQLADDYQVKVKQCKVLLLRSISYCGMNSYASAVSGGTIEYMVKMGSSMCKEAHQTRIYRYSGSIAFHDLEIGKTHIRTAVLSGSVDAEGYCHGGQFSDNFGTWSNVVVTGAFSITLSEYSCTAKTTTDEIRLRSQLICKFSAGYCIDVENGDTVWEPDEEERCNEKKYQVLYEGPATVLHFNKETPEEGATYTVEQDEKIFALKTTGVMDYCLFPMYKTEHPKLLIVPTTTGKFYLKQKQLEPGSLDIMTYINAKFVYVDKVIGKNMRTLSKVLTLQRCMEERRVLFTLLALAYVNPTEFAYAYTGGAGYTAVAAGEVIHLLACLPVEVAIRDTNRCFTELPVLWNNESYFLAPRTRILQRIGTEIHCTSILPSMFQLHQRWYAFTPQITVEPEPSALRPIKHQSFSYKSPANLAKGGIYNQKEIEKMRNHLLFPQERLAITNVITRGAAGHDTANQGIYLSPLIAKDLVREIKTNILSSIWGRFTTFGNIASGIIGLMVILNIIKWLLDTVLHGRILYNLYGISAALVGALSESVTTYLVLRRRSQDLQSQEVDIESREASTACQPPAKKISKPTQRNEIRQAGHPPIWFKEAPKPKAESLGRGECRNL